jgi:hypothetical protein
MAWAAYAFASGQAIDPVAKLVAAHVFHPPNRQPY